MTRTRAHIEILSVRIPAVLKKQIDAEAKKLGMSVNAFIAKLLADHFEKRELTAEIADIRERLQKVEDAVFGTKTTK
ncbi:MAG: toxin-antitoxin system HicB family antitoxin [Thermoguttaceae bacterium]|nr:toxin-antitoxin system HicB family antitoxin [Thermoguttaceae bacterium]